MAEPKKASFSFSKFKVPSFSYKDSGKNETDLKLSFNPKGEFNPKNGKFELTIEFIGFENEKIDEPVIKVIGVSEFLFSEPINLDKIPPYFYNNSIAIVFPYLRAFISTLTLQSNTGVIMLGLLNFTGMGEVLKNNTIISNKL